MNDVASALRDLVIGELPRGVTVRSSVAGLALQLPSKGWLLSQSSCDIIFSTSMVERFRRIAQDDRLLRQPDSITYLEFAAAAVGLAFDRWQLGQPSRHMLLDARDNGIVEMAWVPEAKYRRA
jgi:hypothetical protein